MILLGVLAVIVGIIAIVWPSVTILALVILFAIFAHVGGFLFGLLAARILSGSGRVVAQTPLPRG